MYKDALVLRLNREESKPAELRVKVLAPRLEAFLNLTGDVMHLLHVSSSQRASAGGSNTCTDVS